MKNRNSRFAESALYSRCERVLQGSSVPKIPSYTNYRGANAPVKSVMTTSPAETFKRDAQVYTGSNMVGIATMHKSNSVPVFSADDAKDISRMRRG